MPLPGFEKEAVRNAGGHHRHRGADHGAHLRRRPSTLAAVFRNSTRTGEALHLQVMSTVSRLPAAPAGSSPRAAVTFGCLSTRRPSRHRRRRTVTVATDSSSAELRCALGRSTSATTVVSSVAVPKTDHPFAAGGRHALARNAGRDERGHRAASRDTPAWARGWRRSGRNCAECRSGRSRCPAARTTTCLSRTASCARPR